MQKLIKIGLWYLGANFIFFISFLIFSQLISPHSQISTFIRPNQLSENIVFAALPNKTIEIKTAVTSQDARPLVINRYLKRWGSPLEGMGSYIVSVADKYHIDPYLIVAIAQQESNLGKKMPPNCYNAWGWGIHSKGTLCFSNWQEAIQTFSKGLADSYYAYGLRTPEQIMTKYNAHSPNGAWAKGVSQFLEELRSGDF